MLQFKNRTPFAGTIMLLPDPDGVESLFTVVKATFTMGEKLALADDQVPVAMGQEFFGEPDQSSIKVPSDVSMMKPGTDVMLIGQAHAPGGRATTWMDVTVAVGPIAKTVRVFGDRLWRTSTQELSYSISEPEPFEVMPLVWERAFGGVERTLTPIRGELRNPVGTGYRVSEVAESIAGVRLPNLEDPASPISSWKQSPQPACFAPICAHWEPRRSYAGTYDEEWQKHRAPYLPKDFDPRFLQVAPPGMIVPGCLKGGEPVELRGVTPSGVVQFSLPRVALRVVYLLDGSPQERPAQLDTLIIEPEQSRLLVTWRAVFPCDKKALRVKEIEAELVSLN